MKLHPYFDSPARMVKHSESLFEFCCNTPIAVGDQVTVGYDNEAKPIVKAAVEILSTEESKGDFSNYDRPPYAQKIKF